jgi:hypothetical protein
MKIILTLLIGSFSIAFSIAQDTVPDTHLTVQDTINPLTAKVGDIACVYPVIPSVEKHVWSPREAFKIKNCNMNALKAVKESDGWRIYLKDPLVLHEEATDARCKGSNFIQFAHVSIVK